jgi:hypothetical protein
LRARTGQYERIKNMRGTENPFQLWQDMGQVMTENMTVVRYNDRLRATEAKLQEMQERYERIGVDDVQGWTNQVIPFTRQLQNMLTLARVMTRGALLRDESRGAHYKPDFPDRDDARFLKTTVAEHSPDGPKIRYEDVDISQIKPRPRKYTTDAPASKTPVQIAGNGKVPVGTTGNVNDHANGYAANGTVSGYANGRTTSGVNGTSAAGDGAQHQLGDINEVSRTSRPDPGEEVATAARRRRPACHRARRRPPARRAAPAPNSPKPRPTWPTSRPGKGGAKALPRFIPRLSFKTPDMLMLPMVTSTTAVTNPVTEREVAASGETPQALRQDMATETIEVRVLRQAAPDSEPYWEEFLVPYRPRMNVISLLMEIQKNPTNKNGKRVAPVAWEQACLEEVCGSCTMLINGKVRQSCSALIDKVAPKTHTGRSLDPRTDEQVPDRARSVRGPVAPVRGPQKDQRLDPD